MKFVLRLLMVATYFTGLANAQVNRAVCSSECVLPVPVKAGATIVAMGIWPMGGMTNTQVSDPQGDNWQFAGFLNGRTICLWYALDAVGGTQKVTIPPGIAVEAIIAEYPPSSGIDTQATDQYANGGGELIADVDAIMTSEGGDFIIGLFSDWPSPTGIKAEVAGGYNMRACTGWLTLIDIMDAPKGTYSPSVTYAEPAFSDVWIIAFKPKRVVL